MSLLDKIIGTYSERQLKKIMPTVEAVEALADKYAKMSESELRSVTPKFKERLAAGETLDDILPEAYALVREAADRVLGKRPFDVQILCAILLHQGRIAEMKTGEGKTLVAALPSYLNALNGQGVHIVTVNEYLARLHLGDAPLMDYDAADYLNVERSFAQHARRRLAHRRERVGQDIVERFAAREPFFEYRRHGAKFRVAHVSVFFRKRFRRVDEGHDPFDLPFAVRSDDFIE